MSPEQQLALIREHTSDMLAHATIALRDGKPMQAQARVGFGNGNSEGIAVLDLSDAFSKQGVEGCAAALREFDVRYAVQWFAVVLPTERPCAFLHRRGGNPHVFAHFAADGEFAPTGKAFSGSLPLRAVLSGNAS